MTQKCTYCGGTEFIQGPSGGMSTNVLCANEECRHWFNNTPFGFEDQHRVEPSAKEKECMKSNRAKETSAKRLLLIAEGADLYLMQHNAEDCLKEKPYSGYALVYDDALRLCGYLNAAIRSF